MKHGRRIEPRLDKPSRGEWWATVLVIGGLVVGSVTWALVTVL